MNYSKINLEMQDEYIKDYKEITILSDGNIFLRCLGQYKEQYKERR